MLFPGEPCFAKTNQPIAALPADGEKIQIQSEPMSGFQLLRSRQFALAFAAHGFSTFGSAMVPVALSFALVASGRSATEIGSVLACEAAPNLLLAPVAGVIGDRWPRRTIIICADILRCAAQFAFFAMLASGYMPLPLLLLLAALIGIGNTFYGPAAGGFLPQLVAAKRLQEANAILGMASGAALVIAPALAGIVVGVWGPQWAIAVDAISYGVSAICIAFVNPKVVPVALATSASFFADFRFGLKVLAQRPWMLLLVGQCAILNVFAFPAVLILGPLTYATTAAGAASWGFVLSACGIGGVLGGITALYWKPSNPLVVVELAILSGIVPIALLAAHADPTIMAIAGVMVGATGAIGLTLLATMIQREIPGEALSRVYSILGLIAGGATPVGYALVGPLAAQIGPTYLLCVSIFLVCASVCVAMMTRSIREFSAGARTPASD
jgi:MFS family permease